MFGATIDDNSRPWHSWTWNSHPISPLPRCASILAARSFKRCVRWLHRPPRANADFASALGWRSRLVSHTDQHAQEQRGDYRDRGERSSRPPAGMRGRVDW